MGGNTSSRDNFYKTKDSSWLDLFCTKLANLLGRLMEHSIFSHFSGRTTEMLLHVFLSQFKACDHTPSTRFLKASLMLHRKVNRALNIVAILIFSHCIY